MEKGSSSGDRILQTNPLSKTNQSVVSSNDLNGSSISQTKLVSDGKNLTNNEDNIFSESLGKIVEERGIPINRETISHTSESPKHFIDKVASSNELSVKTSAECFPVPLLLTNNQKLKFQNGEPNSSSMVVNPDVVSVSLSVQSSKSVSPSNGLSHNSIGLQQASQNLSNVDLVADSRQATSTTASSILRKPAALPAEIYFDRRFLSRTSEETRVTDPTVDSRYVSAVKHVSDKIQTSDTSCRGDTSCKTLGKTHDHHPLILSPTLTSNAVTDVATSIHSQSSESADLSSRLICESGTPMSPTVGSRFTDKYEEKEALSTSPPKIRLTNSGSAELVDKCLSEDINVFSDLMTELNHLGTLLRESSDSILYPGTGAYSVDRSKITSAITAASDMDCVEPRRSLQLLDCETQHSKRYDRRSVTSVCSDSRIDDRTDTSVSLSAVPIAASRSTEKIVGAIAGRPPRFYQPSGGIVRSSRSQETYFDSGDVMTFVDIDLDDNIASSVDALHYDTSSMASLDSMGGLLIGGADNWSSDHLEMVDLPEDGVGEISCLQGWIHPHSLNADDVGEDTSLAIKNFQEGGGGGVGGRVVTTQSNTEGVARQPDFEKRDIPPTGPSMKQTLLDRQNVNRPISLHSVENNSVDPVVRPEGHHPDIHRLVTGSTNISLRCNGAPPQHGIALNIDEREAAGLFQNPETTAAASSSSTVIRKLSLKHLDSGNNKVLVAESMINTGRTLDDVRLPTSDSLVVSNDSVNNVATPLGAAQALVFSQAEQDDDVEHKVVASEDESREEKDDDIQIFAAENGVYKGPAYASKEIDRPSAARLAKRLFFLHGFKKGDVSRHLCKKYVLKLLKMSTIFIYQCKMVKALPYKRALYFPNV